MERIRSFFLLLLLPLLICGCGGKTKEASAAPFDPAKDPFLRESTMLSSAENADGAAKNPYDSLSVPTQITKIDGLYFIVDCYHDQVIFHDNIEDPLTDWQVMTNDMIRGHTVSSDGKVYLVDDTENHRVLILGKRTSAEGGVFFEPLQEFTEIGVRPHYIVYHEPTDTFYVWSSMGGEMYLFRRDPQTDRMYLIGIKSIPSLLGVYVRSFTIEGDEILFVSGNKSILRCDLQTFAIKEEYPVPDELAGMIQLTRIGDSFYITISTDDTGNQDAATILRTEDLHDLAEGKYEDVYENFVGGGTPYYLSKIDEKYFLTEHRVPGHSIWSFSVKDGEITDVEAVY